MPLSLLAVNSRLEPVRSVLSVLADANATCFVSFVFRLLPPACSRMLRCEDDNTYAVGVSAAEHVIFVNH